jgi:hypothetical protein
MLREIGIYIYMWSNGKHAQEVDSRRMLGNTEKAIMHIKKR